MGVGKGGRGGGGGGRLNVGPLEYKSSTLRVTMRAKYCMRLLLD